MVERQKANRLGSSVPPEDIFINVYRMQVESDHNVIQFFQDSSFRVYNIIIQIVFQIFYRERLVFFEIKLDILEMC